MRANRRSCDRAFEDNMAAKNDIESTAHASIEIDDVVPAHECRVPAKCPLRALLRQLLSTLAHCLTSPCMRRPSSRKRTAAQRDMPNVIPLPSASSLKSLRLPQTMRLQTHELQQLVLKLRVVAGIYAVLYTYTKTKSEASASQKDAKLTQLVSQNEQQLSTLKQSMKNLLLQHTAEMKLVTEKMMFYQEQGKVLSLKIEHIESINAQVSMADSGSYQDSAATPPLLQSAADAVKEAMAICASNFFSITRKKSVSISLPFLGLADANCTVKPGSSLIKVALQAFLCCVLFEGFEGSFNEGLFEKPNQRKQKLFQDFIRCRYMDGDKLLNENGDFNVFFHSKASSVARQLENLLFTENDATQGAGEGLALVRSEMTSSAFYGDLMRLAKAVWLLHKVAFAFQPSAEIFRICKGSGFDEEFMENVDKLHEESGVMSEGGRPILKNVQFMCVPGFTVRHTVIKSWVYLPQQTSM